MMKNKKYPYYDVAKPHDFRELLHYCNKEYGEKTAFRYMKGKKDISVTYSQFKQDVENFGTFLLSKGFGGAHISLLGENSYNWIVSYFAVVNIGSVIVPIDKELSEEEIAEIVKESDSEAIIFSDTYAEEAEINKISLFNMKDMSGFIDEGKRLTASGNDLYSFVPIDTEKMCTIVFTSGTTSKPKGVMLSQKNLLTDAIVSSENLLLPEGTVLVLPINHTFGFMAGVLCPILRGYSVFISSSLRRVLDDIKTAKPGHISVVPLLVSVIYEKMQKSIRESGKEKAFEVLVKFSNAMLSIGIDLRKKIFRPIVEAFGGNLEMIISGGSPLDEKYIKLFRDIGITVINGYGITECSPIITTMRNKHYNPASVGSIQPQTQVRIVDGEIQVKGDIVFMGYYKNEQATAEAFDGEWFKTGDLGSVDENGMLYITGRKKNLIILSNGKNVSAEELELALMNSIAEIKEVVVKAENDSIVAEIFPDYDISDVESVINQKIIEFNKTQPVYKRIYNATFRKTEFEKTTTKKIKREYNGVIRNA